MGEISNSAPSFQYMRINGESRISNNKKVSMNYPVCVMYATYLPMYYSLGSNLLLNDLTEKSFN